MICHSQKKIVLDSHAQLDVKVNISFLITSIQFIHKNDVCTIIIEKWYWMTLEK